MIKQFILLVILMTSFQLNAQSIKEKSIDVSIGYGISAPNEDIDVSGTGFYAQGEYVLVFSKWFDLRPYAGLILTKANPEDNQPNEPEYKSTANVFLIGGKSRITAPIPWVAPYIEIGVGLSIGSIETFTPTHNLKKSGAIFHIPFSIGLELGPERNFNIAFTYYFHNSLEQFCGAAAFGVSFPLDNN